MKYEFDVTGMSCNHCVMRVRRALENLAGSVDVDLERGRAVVESDRAVPELLAALDQAGYPAMLHS